MKASEAKCPCGCGKDWNRVVWEIARERRLTTAEADERLRNIARRLKKPVPQN